MYCDKEKDIGEFSLEHIFPDALGGSFLPDVFKTRRVCQRCNSISGLFIDGPFIKNSFVQNDRVQSELLFFDANKPSAMPLTYLGRAKNCPLNLDDEICEVWSGPNGGIVYHLHPQSDARYDTLIGGNPIDLKRKPGAIYVFAQSQSIYWNTVLLLSCQKYFKLASKFSGTLGLEQLAEDEYFDSPQERDSIRLQSLNTFSREVRCCENRMDVDFEKRFLAKLALGVGFSLLGDRYINSQYVNQLRALMWEKDYKKRADFATIIGYLNPLLRGLDDSLSFPGLSSIYLFPQGDVLSLCLSLFGMRTMAIPICLSSDLWQSAVPQEGRYYLLASQFQKTLGPFPIPSIISHKLGCDIIDEIQQLESQKSNVERLTIHDD